VALALRGQGLDVVVLESGGAVVSGDGQALLDGDQAALPWVFERQAVGLDGVRLRALGGSSGHWGGMTRALDPIDLEPRPSDGRPGWPITAGELAPFYEDAAGTLELSPDIAPAEWFASQGRPVFVETELVEQVLYRLSPPTRFAERYRPDLEEAGDLTVVLGATVVALTTNTRGDHVTALDVLDPTGRPVRVEPDRVVVAGGGIDVPRLLLVSGVANSSGLVGAGFMEHPHVRTGRAVLRIDPAHEPLLVPGAGAWPAIQLREEVRRERGLLAAALTVEQPGHTDPAPGDLIDGVAALFAAPTTRRTTMLRSEQLPVAANAVRLGRRRDRFGVPLPEVSWQVDERTLDSIDRTVAILADEVARSGFGRMERYERGASLDPGAIEIGCHHMGTARMSDDPGAGVVDRDLRAHDVDNLFVAGSATFPTSGAANPTFTLVALAHRLAATLLA
jgi:choline dehydrogenase-like flavoprotein